MLSKAGIKQSIMNEKIINSMNGKFTMLLFLFLLFSSSSYSQKSNSLTLGIQMGTFAYGFSVDPVPLNITYQRYLSDHISVGLNLSHIEMRNIVRPDYGGGDLVFTKFSSVKVPISIYFIARDKFSAGISVGGQYRFRAIETIYGAPNTVRRYSNFHIDGFGIPLGVKTERIFHQRFIFMSQLLYVQFFKGVSRRQLLLTLSCGARF